MSNAKPMAAMTQISHCVRVSPLGCGEVMSDNVRCDWRPRLWILLDSPEPPLVRLVHPGHAPDNRGRAG